MSAINLTVTTCTIQPVYQLWIPDMEMLSNVPQTPLDQGSLLGRDHHHSYLAGRSQNYATQLYGAIIIT